MYPVQMRETPFDLFGLQRVFISEILTRKLSLKEINSLKWRFHKQTGIGYSQPKSFKK